MATVYQSNEKPKSRIIGQNFARRLSTLFGFQSVKKSQATDEISKNYGVRFVKVDQGNTSYRFKQ